MRKSEMKPAQLRERARFVEALQAKGWKPLPNCGWTPSVSNRLGVTAAPPIT